MALFSRGPQGSDAAVAGSGRSRPLAAPRGDAGQAGVPVLEARNVSMHFKQSGHPIYAVDDVSLTLMRGEITALVGESGSGKTTMARMFSLMYTPTSGEIYFDGKPVGNPKGRAAREYYRHVQLIFQDPFASLNSLKKVRYILGRALTIHKIVTGRAAIEKRTRELLETVNLTPAERYIDRFPADFSGGQRQRIAIARSLALDPAVLLADEPTSMLDASIRLDVLNLLSDLRRDRGLAMLYITHDIASARYLSDNIHVMYGGSTVETGPTEAIIANPLHPYTQQLIAAAPDPAKYRGHPGAQRREVVLAAPVDNGRRYAGCKFADRCPVAVEKCHTAPPPMVTVGRRSAACFLVSEDDLRGTAQSHVTSGADAASASTGASARQAP
ncbi:ABC transporter ATP-binding protein [Micrococcales bacterium 31B]|nr:ABC transporter ATP-binding protein [Micrococcales bacterium 31B]